MASLALSAYLIASRLAGPLAGMLLRRRVARGKEDPQRLGERLGIAGLPRPDGKLIWLHGASVGEAMSLLPLVHAMRARTEAQFLVTTGTVTSAQRIAPLLPEGSFHQYVPVDTAGAVGAFLDHWRPDLGIWVESELWPRLVTETAGRGTPIAMLNARLSARSHRGWLRARGMASALFQQFKLIQTQDQETVARLADFGVAGQFAGNLKALVVTPAMDSVALAALRQTLGTRPVWLAASTHDGEEIDLLRAQRKLANDTGALLILAPRHPDRADAIAAMASSEGLTLARRSAQELPTEDTQVYLADTLGEMDLWHTLAPVTFVGGSLVQRGGHTPFEPIVSRSAVVHGPHVENFAPVYAALRAQNAALLVETADKAGRAVQDLLANPTDREAMAQQAADVHAKLRPDVEGIADAVLSLMQAPS